LRHGRASGLSADLEIELCDRALAFACRDGVALAPSARQPRAVCALPIAARATLSAGKPKPGAPPFGLTLSAPSESGDLRAGRVP
jgi:hypothetical protein